MKTKFFEYNNKVIYHSRKLLLLDKGKKRMKKGICYKKVGLNGVEVRTLVRTFILEKINAIMMSKYRTYICNPITHQILLTIYQPLWKIVYQTDLLIKNYSKNHQHIRMIICHHLDTIRH